mgnify:CR=1 FL=1
MKFIYNGMYIKLNNVAVYESYLSAHSISLHRFPLYSTTHTPGSKADSLEEISASKDVHMLHTYLHLHFTLLSYTTARSSQAVSFLFT